MIERLPTGVPGLDTVRRGGFLRGGLFIIQEFREQARRSSETRSASITSSTAGGHCA
jgi:hypothetical protein